MENRQYYRDILVNIWAICSYYDGYNPNSAKRMKNLVDTVKDMALSGLKKEPQYIKPFKKRENK